MKWWLVIALAVVIILGPAVQVQAQPQDCSANTAPQIVPVSGQDLTYSGSCVPGGTITINCKTSDAEQAPETLKVNDWVGWCDTPFCYDNYPKQWLVRWADMTAPAANGDTFTWIYDIPSSLNGYAIAAECQAVDDCGAISNVGNVDILCLVSDTSQLVVKIYPSTINNIRGTSPLTQDFTAAVGGGSGLINYYFWKNCANTATTLAAAQTACGAPDATYMSSASETKSVTFTYSDVVTTTKIYKTPKVLAVRGSLTAQTQSRVALAPLNSIDFVTADDALRFAELNDPIPLGAFVYVPAGQTIDYYFWKDCADPSTSLAYLSQSSVCGTPTSFIGEVKNPRVASFSYNSFATPKVLAYSGGVWSEARTGISQVTGSVIKDDNGNGIKDAGELYIHDPYPCNFCSQNDYEDFGVFVKTDCYFNRYPYTNTFAENCDGSKPVFSMLNVPASGCNFWIDAPGKNQITGAIPVKVNGVPGQKKNQDLYARLNCPPYIDLSPHLATIEIGQTQKYTATYYPRGFAPSCASSKLDVTSLGTTFWDSTIDRIAKTPDGTCTGCCNPLPCSCFCMGDKVKGNIVGAGEGISFISAYYSDVYSYAGHACLEVKQTSCSPSLTIGPTLETLYSNGANSKQFTVKHDPDGPGTICPQEEKEVTFDTGTSWNYDASFVSMSTAGKFSGLKLGNIKISATYQGLTAVADVMVVPPPTINPSALKVLISPTLIESPTAPIERSLTATVIGSATGPINYYFWKNCGSSSAILAEVTNACGEPQVKFLGDSRDSVTDYYLSFSVSGKAKVLVEREYFVATTSIPVRIGGDTLSGYFYRGTDFGIYDGTNPVSFYLGLEVSGTATGPITYYAWKDCLTTSSDYNEVIQDCGQADFVLTTDNTYVTLDFKYDKPVISKMLVNRGTLWDQDLLGVSELRGNIVKDDNSNGNKDGNEQFIHQTNLDIPCSNNDFELDNGISVQSSQYSFYIRPSQFGNIDVSPSRCINNNPYYSVLIAIFESGTGKFEFPMFLAPLPSYMNAVITGQNPVTVGIKPGTITTQNFYVKLGCFPYVDLTPHLATTDVGATAILKANYYSSGYGSGCPNTFTDITSNSNLDYSFVNTLVAKPPDGACVTCGSSYCYSCPGNNVQGKAIGVSAGSELISVLYSGSGAQRSYSGVIVRSSTSVPTVTVSHQPSSPKPSDTLTITATATPVNGRSIKNVKIFVDGTEKKSCTSSPCSYSQTYNYLPSCGTYKYKASATDSADLTGWSTEGIFYPNNLPTVTQISSTEIISGICYQGDTINLHCPASDIDNELREVRVWAGECSGTCSSYTDASWQTKSGTTYLENAVMSDSGNGDYTKTIRVTSAPGTKIAATCQATDMCSGMSNWGDKYPLCTVAARPTLTVTLTASPYWGTTFPFSSTLTATVGGAATGTVTYYFWQNCDESSSDLDTVKYKCGDPTPAAGTSSNQMTFSYYTSANPKVIVQRSGQYATGSTSVVFGTPTLTASLDARYKYVKNEKKNPEPFVLELRSSGTAMGTNNYYFWENCLSTSSNYATVVEACGTPSATIVSERNYVQLPYYFNAPTIAKMLVNRGSFWAEDRLGISELRGRIINDYDEDGQKDGNEPYIHQMNYEDVPCSNSDFELPSPTYEYMFIKSVELFDASWQLIPINVQPSKCYNNEPYYSVFLALKDSIEVTLFVEPAAELNAKITGPNNVKVMINKGSTKNQDFYVKLGCWPYMDVTPHLATVTVGQTQTFKAVSYLDGFGPQCAATQMDVTSLGDTYWNSINWSVAKPPDGTCTGCSDPPCGACTGDLVQGRMVSVATGSAQIRTDAYFYWPLVLHGQAGLVVKSTCSPTLTVTPANPTIDVGGTKAFAATYDADGVCTASSPQPVTNFATWTSSNTNIPPTSTKGTFIGNAAGVATITASYNPGSGTLIATTILTVTQTNRPPTISSLTPLPVCVKPGMIFGISSQASDPDSADQLTLECSYSGSLLGGICNAMGSCTTSCNPTCTSIFVPAGWTDTASKTVSCLVKDKAGIPSSGITTTMNNDNAVPSFGTLTISPGGRTPATQITISGSASDTGCAGMKSYKISVDGSTTNACSGTSSCTISGRVYASGSHQVKEESCDNLDNCNTKTTTLDICIPPSKPNLVSPSVSTCTSQPAYSWNAISSVTKYYLWVSEGGTPVIQINYTAAQVGCSSGTGTCSISPSTALKIGSSYAWWVQAYDACDSSPQSDQRTFTVANPPPPAPTLNSPTGIILITLPNYVWNLLSTASEYYLWVRELPSLEKIQIPNIPSFFCSGSTCSYQPPGTANTLASGKSYNWWVRGSNICGDGLWGGPLSFSIDSNVPTVSVSHQPAYPTSADKVKITGSGTASGSRTITSMEIWADSGSGYALKNTCTGATCIYENIYSYRAGCAPYKYKASATDSGGLTGWSLEGSFTVNDVPAVTPVSSPDVLIQDGNVYCVAGTDVRLICNAADPNNELNEVRVWAGECTGSCSGRSDASWATGTGTTYLNGASMTGSAPGDYTKTIRVTSAPGTKIAATCQATDKCSGLSNWGDKYPLCTVIAPPTLTVTLAANPSSGATPLASTLTATIGGTATGTPTYYFWQYCSETTENLADAKQVCGDPSPSLGTSSNQMSFNYISTGTSKVIVERGGNFATANAVVTVNVKGEVKVTLTAGTTVGPSPLNIPLTATVTGSTSGKIDYYFWWNCVSDSIDYYTIATLCGPHEDVLGSSSTIATVSLPYTTSATSKVLINRDGMWNESRVGISELIGDVLKDDDGNKAWSSGELYIRDPSGPVCYLDSFALSGVTITYSCSSGTVSGSALNNKCNIFTGNPKYSIINVPAGQCTVGVTMPDGWLSTGLNNIPVSITSGQATVQGFSIKQTTGCSSTYIPAVTPVSSPDVLIQDGNVYCIAGTDVRLICNAIDLNSELKEVKFWAGECTGICSDRNYASWATGTGTTYLNGASMTGSGNGDYTKTIRVTSAPGTKIAATCQATNKCEALSNWGDKYPLCTVIAPPTLTVTLAANPSSGATPLASTLTATIGGTATGTPTYYFWQYCSETTEKLADARSVCGDPTPSLGTSSNQMSFNYISTGKSKVIVERGGAFATGDATVTVNAKNEVKVILTAGTTVGPPPLNIPLTATVTGSTSGRIDYYFWQNCTSPSKDYNTVKSACGTQNKEVLGSSYAFSTVGFVYLNNATPKVLINRDGMWNESQVGINELRGKVLKDDDGDAVWDSGELYIRDPSGPACLSNSFVQSGIIVSYSCSSGTVSGSALNNKCSLSTGDPIYSIINVPAGQCTVGVAPPNGWSSTGANNVLVSITSGQATVQGLSIKQTTGCSPTFNIDPAAATINTGESKSFTALYDPDGPGTSCPQEATDVALDTNTAWSSSDGTIAGSSGTKGNFISYKSGTVTITASYNSGTGIMTSTSTLTVNSPLCPQWIEITPKTQDIYVGDKFQYTVTWKYGYDGYGSSSCKAGCSCYPLDVTAFSTTTWSSSNTNVADFTEIAGRILGKSTGTVTVTATYNPGNTMSDTAVLNVKPSVSAGITLCPKFANVTVSEKRNFYLAYWPKGYGNPPLVDATNLATWTISDTGLATNLGNGAFMPLKTGSATITASYKGITQTSILLVRSSPALSLFYYSQRGDVHNDDNYVDTWDENAATWFVPYCPPTGPAWCNNSVQTCFGAQAWNSSDPTLIQPCSVLGCAGASCSTAFMKKNNTANRYGLVEVNETIFGASVGLPYNISPSPICIFVWPPNIALAEIIPTQATIQAGGQQRFNISRTSYSSLGVATDDISGWFTWGSSDGTVASNLVSPFNMYTGLKKGTTTVTANCNLFGCTSYITPSSFTAVLNVDDVPTICGNGVAEGSEACDLGDSTHGNGNGACPKTCSDGCTNNNCGGGGGDSVCGNGAKESGEACDLGSNNGPCPKTCSASCTNNNCGGAVCGNGVVEGSEACDLGSNNGPCPKTCSASCTVNGCGGGGCNTPSFMISKVVPDPTTAGVVTIAFSNTTMLTAQPEVSVTLGVELGKTSEYEATFVSNTGNNYVFNYAVQQDMDNGQADVKVRGVCNSINGMSMRPFVIDTTPPQTTINCNGDACEPAYFLEPVTVRVTCDDQGFGAQGCKEIDYKLDGASQWTTIVGSTATFQVWGFGDHQIEYYAKDNLDNTQSPVIQKFSLYKLDDVDIKTDLALSTYSVKYGNMILATLSGTVVSKTSGVVLETLTNKNAIVTEINITMHGIWDDYLQYLGLTPEQFTQSKWYITTGSWKFDVDSSRYHSDIVACLLHTATGKKVCYSKSYTVTDLPMENKIITKVKYPLVDDGTISLVDGLPNFPRGMPIKFLASSRADNGLWGEDCSKDNCKLWYDIKPVGQVPDYTDKLLYWNQFDKAYRSVSDASSSGLQCNTKYLLWIKTNVEKSLFFTGTQGAQSFELNINCTPALTMSPGEARTTVGETEVVVFTLNFWNSGTALNGLSLTMEPYGKDDITGEIKLDGEGVSTDGKSAVFDVPDSSSKTYTVYLKRALRAGRYTIDFKVTDEDGNEYMVRGRVLIYANGLPEFELWQFLIFIIISPLIFWKMDLFKGKNGK